VNMSDGVEFLRLAITTCNTPAATVLVDYCYPGWTFSGVGTGLHRLFATLIQLGHTIDAENAEIKFISFQPFASDANAPILPSPDNEIQLVLRLNGYDDDGAGRDEFTTGLFFKILGPELSGNDQRILGLIERIERIQQAFVRELLPAVREHLLIRGPGAPSPNPDGDVEIPRELGRQCQDFAQRIPEFITAPNS
jgi:hypothetical protein